MLREGEYGDGLWVMTAVLTLEDQHRSPHLRSFRPWRTRRVPSLRTCVSFCVNRCGSEDNDEFEWTQGVFCDGVKCNDDGSEGKGAKEVGMRSGRVWMSRMGNGADDGS